jgi:PAS domain S-box-containing protein
MLLKEMDMAGKSTVKEMQERIRELESQNVRLAESLRRNEEERRLIVDTMPGLFSNIDKQGRYRFINKGGAQWFGLKRKEIIGKHLKDILGEETVEMIKPYVDRALSGKPARYESALPLKHGPFRWIIAELLPSFDEHGNPDGYSALVFDITDRKRAEDALRESEQKYRTLFDESKDAICISDQDGGVLDANPIFLELFGYNREDLHRGVHWQHLYVEPDGRERFLQAIDLTGSLRNYEAKLRKKNGGAIDCLLTATKRTSDDGKPLGFQGIIRDITEQKRAEASLKELMLRNNLILQNAIDGFMIVDTEGKMLETNHAAALALGYAPDEMAGMNIRDIEIPTRSLAGERSAASSLRGMGERFETKFRRKDKRIVHVEVRSSFVQMDNHAFYYYFFHDISERKRARQTLLRREKQLETKTQRLEEVNTALKVLLKKRDEDRTDLEEKMLFNTKELVMPYVKKLRDSGLTRGQKVYADIIASHLGDIISPFAHRLSSKYYGFTPREIRVAELVKQGKTNKEIAELFSTSSRTIAFHRENIRKKLGLRNKKFNLEAHLLTLA